MNELPQTLAPLRIDPQLDLVLERLTDIPIDLVWEALTEAPLIQRWFTPAPWTTPLCQIDLRPGGIFRTVMRAPDGQEVDNTGCILEVVPSRRLVWTGALGPGFRPRPAVSGVPFLMTAVVELTPQNGKTAYTATVMHADEAARAAHDAMGFHKGWGAAFDQLVSIYKPDSTM